MGVREIARFLEQWQMGVKDLRRRMIPAPTPRERERWYAILLLAQGWTAKAEAEALERDPHTIGPLLQAQEGVGLRGGRARCLGLQVDRGAPRPWRDAAGGVEGSGPRVTGDSRHRPGQLELEGGPSVCLGTMRGQPVPQQLPELPPFSRGQALPGNSPDCNADEAVWGWVREEATGNLCLGSKALAQQKVGNFLSGLASRSGEVKRRCRTVLQSRAEALLRDSQPDSGHTPNTHPTLALV